MPRTPEEKRAHSKQMYNRHKEKILVRRKAYRAKHRERYLAQGRAYQIQRSRKKIDEEIPYAAPARCESCHINFSETAKGPCLDHCHTTNRFRGWLCHKCNAALGMVGDSPDGVRHLLDYITRAYAMLDARLSK